MPCKLVWKHLEWQKLIWKSQTDSHEFVGGGQAEAFKRDWMLGCKFWTWHFCHLIIEQQVFVAWYSNRWFKSKKKSLWAWKIGATTYKGLEMLNWGLAPDHLRHALLLFLVLNAKGLQLLQISPTCLRISSRGLQRAGRCFLIATFQ